MLFDQGTPDTSVYMLAGYSIFFVISIIYLASLLIRTRNLHRDLDTLESLREEKQAPAPAPAAVKAKPAGPKAVKPGPSRKRPARKSAKSR
ncbi:MAG TPA: hypothetical protein VF784_06350 [Anaerolineales bacterium]